MEELQDELGGGLQARVGRAVAEAAKGWRRTRPLRTPSGSRLSSARTARTMLNAHEDKRRMRLVRWRNGCDLQQSSGLLSFASAVDEMDQDQRCARLPARRRAARRRGGWRALAPAERTREACILQSAGASGKVARRKAVVGGRGLELEGAWRCCVRSLCAPSSRMPCASRRCRCRATLAYHLAASDIGAASLKRGDRGVRVGGAAYRPSATAHAGSDRPPGGLKRDEKMGVSVADMQQLASGSPR